MTEPNFEVLKQMAELITKYQLKELTLNQDGSITIVKEVHVPKIKQVRKRKSKADSFQDPFPGMAETDLPFVAANLNSNKLNNHTRLQTRSVLPFQGKSK